jgi:hypothetical protein
MGLAIERGSVCRRASAHLIRHDLAFADGADQREFIGRDGCDAVGAEDAHAGGIVHRRSNHLLR